MTDTTDTSAAPGQPGAAPAPPPPPPPPPPGAKPPLRRSVTDRKIVGVAGGLGRYFDVDPLIFRVVFVTLAVFGGSGLLLYAVGWLLIPEDGEHESEASRLINGRVTPKIIGGILLAVVGLAVVGNFARSNFGFGGFAALVAIFVAAWLISRNDGDRPLVAPRNPSGPSPAPIYGPPAPSAYGQTPGTAYASAGQPTTGPAQPTGLMPPPPGPGAPFTGPAGQPGGSGYPPPPYQGFAPPVPAPWTPPPPRPRSRLGMATLSIALVVAGLLVSLNLATTHDVPAETVLAICLGIVGLGLVVGAFVGRARGLIFVGAVLVVATSVAGVSRVGWQGGIGDRTWAPRTVAGVHDTYRLAIGNARLDLSHLHLAPGQSIDVNVRHGVGDLTIVLPDQVSADVTADVNAGAIRLPSGAEQSGTSLHRRYVNPRGTTTPTITIDAELGVGSLEVQRATS